MSEISLKTLFRLYAEEKGLDLSMNDEFKFTNPGTAEAYTTFIKEHQD